MARAGYCAECAANVYLNADGSCPNGHPSSSISGAYEVADVPEEPQLETSPPPVAPAAPGAQPPPGPATPAGPPPKKRNTVLIVVVSVAVALLLCCVTLGIMLTIGGRALQSSYTANMGRALCFSNQQTIEGETQMWVAAKKGRKLSDLGTTFDEVVAGLVSEGLTNKAPTCRDGGVYTWEPAADGKSGLLRCSIHGHYTDPVD